MPAGGVLVLVGDPGRRARQADGAEGILALVGPGIVPGAMAAGGERDIAPTVLHLLGLPVSDELEGAVLEAALTPAFRAAHPVRRVASYGLRPQPSNLSRYRRSPASFHTHSFTFPAMSYAPKGEMPACSPTLAGPPPPKLLWSSMVD